MKELLAIILVLVFVVSFIILVLKSNKKNKKNINEWSYKRYADFYGSMELADPLFDEKINKILKLIKDDKCDDIDFIAKESGCTKEECCLKINYLKNKRLLDNFYIDKDTFRIIRCSEEDIELIEKYKPYIYGTHAPLDEIVALVPSKGTDLEDKKKEVIKELKYLIDNNILNGVKFNEVDNKLVYYHIEKHKKEKDYVTISCPKCGALNDVDYGNKVRCKYCNSIVEAYKTLEELKKE
jgi:hypothetical protein